MSYVKHQIVYGETLQSISQEKLGTAGRWIEIAALNNLNFPYIVDHSVVNPSVNVKRVGDDLLIPMEEAAINIIPKEEVFDIYNSSLGQDVSIFSEEYIELTSGGVGEFTADVYGDLSVVSGFQNLRQSLFMRLITPEGTLLHHPDYGSRIGEIIGRKATSDTIQRLRIEVERVMRSDPRVENIEFLGIQYDGNLLEVSARIIPIGLEAALEISLSLGKEDLENGPED